MTTGVHQPSPLIDKSAKSAACLGFQARAYEWICVGILRSDGRSDADNHTIAGKGRSAIFICFVLIAFLLLPLMARTASAEPGLDLVVVIDQSNSMSGAPPWSRAPNDPLDHRATAFHILAAGLAAHVGGNNAVHRLSVIEYGTDSRLVIDGQEFRHNPAEPAAAVIAAAQRIKQVKPQSLMWTNTPDALATAGKASKRLKDTDPDPARKRVLLLVTDGRPFLKRPDGTVPALETMRREITKTVKGLQADGVEFWAIGLNDSSNYWGQGDGDFWRNLAGGAARAPEAQKPQPAMSALVRQLLSGWLGSKSIAVTGGKFTIDPFVSKLSVIASFEKPLEDVVLKDPAGKIVPLTAGASSGNPAIYAQYLLDDPVPGEYEVIASALNPVTGTVEKVPPAIDLQITGPRMRLLQPSGPITVGTPVNLVAQAYGNDSSRPMPFPAPFPELTVELKGPAGPPTTVKLTTTDGIQFASSFTPADVGAYTSTASLRTISRRAIELADGGRLDDLTVSAAPPPRLSLVTPILSEVQGVSPLSPSVNVQVELVDSVGTALKPEDIDGLVSSPDQWLSLKPLDASGVAIGQPIPLKRRDGRFELDWPVDFQFSRGEGILRPAIIHARIDQNPMALKSNAAIAPGINLPAEVIGNRIAGDPSTIANVSVRISWPWLAALAIPLLLVITAIVIPLLLVLRRQLSMGRQDRIYRDLALRIYDPLVGPISGSGIKIPLAGKTVHKLDGRYSIRDGAAQRSLRRLIVTRNLDATPPKVEIVYQLDQATTVSRTTVQFGKPPQSLTGTFTNSFVFELLSQRPAAPP